ncbi:MAG: sigma-70 family RNA polymerase sigma factor [Planctomycetota bacterium]
MSHAAPLPEPAARRVTELVRQLGGGDPAIAQELLPLVYDQLRAIAGGIFARQPGGHTLQPTALVHEAWLKLGNSEEGWQTRNHFFAVAARAMRQVLTDHARARRADKRGKGVQKVTFDDQLGAASHDYDLIDVSEAIERLATANERHARVVELRLFAGLTVDEVADVLDLTPRTVKLDWRSARAWLQHALVGPKP